MKRITEENWREKFDEEFSTWEAADAWDYSGLRDMSDCDFYDPIKHFIQSLIESVKEEEINNCISIVYKVYTEKYRHITRDYRKEDQFRDDIVRELRNKALVKSKSLTEEEGKEKI